MFQRKYNLEKHLKDNRCHGFKNLTAFEVYKIIVQKESNTQNALHKVFENTTKSQFNVDIQNNIKSTNNTYTKHNNENFIKVNPVNKIKTEYITNNEIVKLIEERESSNLIVFLEDYIKNMFCNEKYPENHSVKYIRRKPPTFNILIEGVNGDSIFITKGLKDTCELLVEHVFNELKMKTNEYIKNYKDDEFFDISEINLLYIKLNNNILKRAISSVLQYNILNNTFMKFH